MKELVEFIAKRLVDKPEEVIVKERESETTMVIELKVAQEDIGKIIGKEGKTIRSIRLLLSASSAKMRKRAVLELIEDDKPPRVEPATA